MASSPKITASKLPTPEEMAEKVYAQDAPADNTQEDAPADNTQEDAPADNTQEDAPAAEDPHADQISAEQLKTDIEALLGKMNGEPVSARNILDSLQQQYGFDVRPRKAEIKALVQDIQLTNAGEDIAKNIIAFKEASDAALVEIKRLKEQKEDSDGELGEDEVEFIDKTIAKHEITVGHYKKLTEMIVQIIATEASPPKKVNGKRKDLGGPSFPDKPEELKADQVQSIVDAIKAFVPKQDGVITCKCPACVSEYAYYTVEPTKIPVFTHHVVVLNEDGDIAETLDWDVSSGKVCTWTNGPPPFGDAGDKIYKISAEKAKNERFYTCGMARIAQKVFGKCNLNKDYPRELEKYAKEINHTMYGAEVVFEDDITEEQLVKLGKEQGNPNTFFAYTSDTHVIVMAPRCIAQREEIIPGFKYATTLACTTRVNQEQCVALFGGEIAKKVWTKDTRSKNGKLAAARRQVSKLIADKFGKKFVPRKQLWEATKDQIQKLTEYCQNGVWDKQAVKEILKPLEGPSFPDKPQELQTDNRHSTAMDSTSGILNNNCVGLCMQQIYDGAYTTKNGVEGDSGIEHAACEKIAEETCNFTISQVNNGDQLEEVGKSLGLQTKYIIVTQPDRVKVVHDRIIFTKSQITLGSSCLWNIQPQAIKDIGNSDDCTDHTELGNKPFYALTTEKYGARLILIIHGDVYKGNRKINGYIKDRYSQLRASTEASNPTEDCKNLFFEDKFSWNPFEGGRKLLAASSHVRLNQARASLILTDGQKRLYSEKFKNGSALYQQEDPSPSRALVLGGEDNSQREPLGQDNGLSIPVATETGQSLRAEDSDETISEASDDNDAVETKMPAALSSSLLVPDQGDAMDVGDDGCTM